MTLLPCPFCGGEASLKHDQGNENWNKSWRAECNNCHVAQKIFYGSNSWNQTSNKTRKFDKDAENSAITAWNTRHIGDVI